MRKPVINLPSDYDVTDDSVTLVAASTRLARELRYACDYQMVKAKKTVWTRPQIQSYTQWLLHSYSQLGSSDPQLALRSVVSNETFMLLAQQQAPNDDVEMHARAIVDAWQLVWDANLWVDFQDIRSTENGRLCADWFQRISRYLERERLITIAEIPDVIQRAIERHNWRPRGVLTYGFSDESVAQRNLFATLRALDLCSEVNVTPALYEHVTHQLLGFENANEEFSTLALWTREMLAKYGADATIGVVVNGLGNSFSAVKRSFESVFPEIADINRLVSIDSGQSLTQNRVYLDFVYLMKWTCGPLRHDLLLQLAKSPYFERLNLQRKPQKWFREHMTIRHYRSRMPRGESIILDRIVQSAPRDPNQQRPFTEVADAMVELLRICGYTAEATDRFAQIDANAISVFNDLVLRLAQAATIQPRISWSRFIDLIEILAADQTIQVSRPDAPIQVMGRSASTLLQFDALWVTGVSDVDWPAVPRPNPFIPRLMQKRANLRGISHEQMLEDAQVLTKHWRNCAHEVVFTYVSQIDKVEAQPSNLFEDLSNAKQTQGDVPYVPVVNGAELIQHGHPWATFSVSDVIREYQQNYGSQIAANDVKAATRLLRNQALCPFKGWAVHRVGLEEINEPISRFPNAAQRGSLFHYVVERILKRAKTQEELAKLDERIFYGVIDEVLATEDVAKNLPARFLKHERERIRRWIEAWLEVQINRRQPFEVLEVEKEIHTEINGLTFMGKIDRIDRTDTLDCLIIDHKTGSSYTPNSWDPDQMSDTQMPMYATAEANCDGIAYLSIYRTIDGLRSRWQGVEQSTQHDEANELAVVLANYESLEALKQAWRDRLSQIVADHLDGRADVSPVDSNVCTYCHLSNLCRIYEDQTIEYAEKEV